MKNIDKIKKVFPDTGQCYRVSGSAWAGGNHYFNIKIGPKTNASGWSDRVWSSNGKWSGNDSNHAIIIKKSWLRCVYNEGIQQIGSLVTLDAKKIGQKEYTATWIEQSKGFGLKMISGFILRGHHFQNISLQNAKKKLKKMRNIAAKNLINNRFDIKNAATVFVSIDDSIKAGNCPEGTRNFAQIVKEKIGGNIGAVRGDYLLKIQNDIYTKRAIAAAVGR